jgi:hypothetical protein
LNAQTRGTVDAYTEEGGDFPVAINAYKQTTEEGRLGAAVKVSLGTKTDLRASGEWVHRFDGGGPGATGEILGDLGSFSTPGQVVARTGLASEQTLTKRSHQRGSVHVGLRRCGPARVCLGFEQRLAENRILALIGITEKTAQNGAMASLS